MVPAKFAKERENDSKCYLLELITLTKLFRSPEPLKILRMAVLTEGMLPL